MVLHEANPSIAADVFQIIEELQKHVPKTDDGHFITMPAFGDGLSVDRMVDAQKWRLDALTEEGTLQGGRRERERREGGGVGGRENTESCSLHKSLV